MAVKTDPTFKEAVEEAIRYWISSHPQQLPNPPTGTRRDPDLVLRWQKIREALEEVLEGRDVEFLRRVRTAQEVGGRNPVQPLLGEEEERPR